MKLSAILEPMLAAGVPADVILATVKAFEDQHADALQKRREADAKRQAEKRARDAMSRDSRDVTVTVSSRSAGDARVEDNLQTKNSTGQEKEERNARDARLPSPRFAEFWSLYPNKVGKGDAEGAYLKALKRADHETIMAGLRRYVAKTDDRPWCNPGTFLRQSRWEDAPAAVAPAPRQTAPPRPQTHGSMWANEAKSMGLTDDEPAYEPTRYDLAGQAPGHDRGPRTIELSALPAGRRGH